MRRLLDGNITVRTGQSCRSRRSRFSSEGKRPDPVPRAQTQSPGARPSPQGPDPVPRGQTQSPGARPSPQGPDPVPRGQTQSPGARPSTQGPDPVPRGHSGFSHSLKTDWGQSARGAIQNDVFHLSCREKVPDSGLERRKRGEEGRRGEERRERVEERKGEERRGEERKGEERRGKERRGKERRGEERMEGQTSRVCAKRHHTTAGSLGTAPRKPTNPRFPDE
ncbi:unnamed protein product [Pleuronectes platessa]|uniref:Uncharacterized protein n=1 Tax=Pleuronectes platessa TaxID=8262 RepID=A0A9N7V813_PLEPL|nr:unnamed protein product [Pleuronectes platessa]